MIHSARPTVSPVANIVFCCFVFLDLKRGDGRTICAKTMIPTGRDFGLAEWIKKEDLQNAEIGIADIHLQACPKPKTFKTKRCLNSFLNSISTNFAI